MSEVSICAPDAAPGPSASSDAGWRAAMRHALRSGDDLAAAAGLGGEEAAALTSADAAEAARRFPVRVPLELASRMRRGDGADPILLQVAPRSEELSRERGFTRDPLGEAAASPVPGLLHKYRGRVLLVLTGACPVHCRYCFRRHFPYGEHALSPAALERALEHIRADPSIAEVILSGGDPLSLDDGTLSEIERRLTAIPHLRRLRVHTRWPIASPARVTAELLDWLGRTRLAPVVVVHSNHPAEIDGDVRRGLAALREAGPILLNQSVLLRGVNDRADVLCALSEALHHASVQPYYLHLLDPVEGAAHFAVPDAEGRRLIAEMAARLPGYLVPRLVREEQGRPGKTVLTPELSAPGSVILGAEPSSPTKHPPRRTSDERTP